MSAKLRAALATVLVMETIEGAHHAARIALASEPPATGLDVERLARAWSNVFATVEASDFRITRLAAEYARLTGAAE